MKRFALLTLTQNLKVVNVYLRNKNSKEGDGNIIIRLG